MRVIILYNFEYLPHDNVVYISRPLFCVPKGLVVRLRLGEISSELCAVHAVFH